MVTTTTGMASSSSSSSSSAMVKTPSEYRRLDVLVIAHPDDESMFFVPTIRGLIQQQQQQQQQQQPLFWIMCLTTGDYDGLGRVRCKEMARAGKLLLSDAEGQVLQRDHLQDHPKQRWDAHDVADEIQSALIDALQQPQSAISEIHLITFDEHGVSGHVNHTDTYHGVARLMKRNATTTTATTTTAARKPGCELQVSPRRAIPITASMLVSQRNIVAKYVPWLEWLLLIVRMLIGDDPYQMACERLCSATQNEATTHRLHEPSLNWNAMATHASQFVWYRRLFVVFSCYTYVNQLRPLR